MTTVPPVPGRDDRRRLERLSPFVLRTSLPAPGPPIITAGRPARCSMAAAATRTSARPVPEAPNWSPSRCPAASPTGSAPADCIEIDFMSYVGRHYPAGFATFLQQTYEPADILFRPAAHAEVVALNGAGFDRPPWSIRLSPADLDEADYRTIGRAVRSVGEEYLAQWRAAER